LNRINRVPTAGPITRAWTRSYHILPQFALNALIVFIVNLVSATEIARLQGLKDDADFSNSIEGSAKSGGKGPSVWDQFIREFPEKIKDNSNLEVAADSYNRYKEDVSILKDLGVNAYRFSIPWTRILPDGTLGGGINQEGISHYNSFIDELIKNDIEPFVTILHFDSPEALEN
ncbi:hypothetical protein Godav_012676, partial [Gossypium davidsonii]|nr:hypothetical protein [Gossypium davidsonii]